jgi:hypothetical protein
MAATVAVQREVGRSYRTGAYLVKEAEALFAGSYGALDASGLLVAFTGDPAEQLVGLIERSVTGDVSEKVMGEVITEEHEIIVAVTGASAITDVGKKVYISDDSTFTLTQATGTRLLGEVTEYRTGTECRVAVLGFGARRALDAAGAGSVLQVADPGDAGAIPVTHSASVGLTTAGAETRTVAVPTFIGQKLNLYLDVDGGNCVITFASGINQIGNTIATGADAGDHLSLEAIEIGAAKAWRIVANDGWALS